MKRNASDDHPSKSRGIDVLDRQLDMKGLLLGSVLIGVYFATPYDAQAAKLEAGAVKAWETYVQLTEKRIEAELNSTSGFLPTDFLPPGEASRITGIPNSGGVYIEKMNTRLADGREVPVPGGMIHHWFSSIFIPGIRLQTLLNWVKDYDQHYRYFNEVEQSKLLSGRRHLQHIPAFRPEEGGHRSLQHESHGRLSTSPRRTGVQPQFHNTNR